MTLYLMLAQDDAATAASLLLYPAESIDDVLHAVTDLGGETHSLVVTAGLYSLAGVIDLPDEPAAVAFQLVMRARGRNVDLAPAAPLTAFTEIVERARTITTTSPGDGPAEEPPHEERA